MAFLKKEQDELQSTDIKNERANICALFGKSHDQNNPIMFEKILPKINFSSESLHKFFSTYWFFPLSLKTRN